MEVSPGGDEDAQEFVKGIRDHESAAHDVTLQPVDRGCPDPHAMHSPAVPFDVDSAARPGEGVAVDVGADVWVSHPGEHGNWLGGHRNWFPGAAAFFPGQADRCGWIRVRVRGLDRLILVSGNLVGLLRKARVWPVCAPA